jgi:hypothetical protein
MMHNKLLIVDRELVSVGSTNFDVAASLFWARLFQQIGAIKPAKGFLAAHRPFVDQPK